MNEIEGTEAYEDLILSGNDGYVPTRYATNLKEGVDLTELRRGEGTFFEVDEHSNEMFRNSDDEDSSPYFDSEQMFQQLNHEVLGMDEGDEELNADNSKTPFESMAVGMEDLTGDAGVLKKILKPGTGPVVPKNATVRFHANGYKEYCDEPYDSSRFRGRPEQMKLGEGAFPGMDIGVSTMRKGEIARFLFDKEYVFKDLGCEPRVPGATVMWEIELLTFVDHGPEGDLETQYPKAERRKTSFKHLLDLANGERETGNDFYKRKLFQQALKKYTRAIKLLEECNLQNEDEERMMNQVLLKLYGNMAQCALDLSQEARCIKYARKVLYIDPKNAKAFFKMGKAFMKQGEFDKARDNFMKARRYCPASREVRDALIELDKNVEKFKALEKEQCLRMFRGMNVADSDEIKKSDPAKDVPEDMKEMLSTKLRNFIDDENVKELAFPATLSEQEMSYVQDVASSMGLKSDFKTTKGKKQLIVTR